jgi:hypothetical protein
MRDLRSDWLGFPPRGSLYATYSVCNAPRMLLIIGLVLAGWTVASVIVAGLTSTVIRGAAIRPEAVAPPRDYIDLTDPSTRVVSASADMPRSIFSR